VTDENRFRNGSEEGASSPFFLRILSIRASDRHSLAAAVGAPYLPAAHRRPDFENRITPRRISREFRHQRDTDIVMIHVITDLKLCMRLFDPARNVQPASMRLW